MSEIASFNNQEQVPAVLSDIRHHVGNVIIDHELESNNNLLRYGETVRAAPVFADQVQDDSRTNAIEYIAGTNSAYDTTAHEFEGTTVTEHESLQGLQTFLQNTIAASNIDPHTIGLAISMLENLTYIGEKEYDEATKALASTWAEQLKNNPAAQICVIAERGDDTFVKSGAFLRENVLKNISDDDLESLSGRLLFDPADLTAEVDNAEIVLLDDWIISGTQLGAMAMTTAIANPKYVDRIRIQVVAATDEIAHQGIPALETEYSKPFKGKPIPVAAYYAAHAVDRRYAPRSGAHITGSHCSVDYDFNHPLTYMSDEMGVPMPPTTNIIRPYRQNGFELSQINRLRGVDPGKYHAFREVVPGEDTYPKSLTSTEA